MARRARGGIPSFSLYGERPAKEQIDALHIEDIPSRSRKYLWQIGMHRHMALCQCVFVTSGPVAATLDESRTDLRGPAVMIVPAGTVHAFRFRADTQGYVLTVDLARLLTMAPALHQAPIEALFSVPRIIDLGQDPLLAGRAERLLESLLQEFKQPESSIAPIGGWLACCVLWVLALGGPVRAVAGPHGAQDLDRLRRFRLLIESHYLRHWPVERYAGQLAVSETSLNRLCRRLTGSTAFELIQQRLALESRRRLVYVLGSVAAISAELGFQDPAYFCRFFRRHCGVSPSAFRRRQVS